MFLVKASVLLEELHEHVPNILRLCRAAYRESGIDLDFIRLGEKAYRRVAPISFDHAVMEKTRKAVVVPLRCEWRDVGTWERMWHIGKKDRRGNVQRGDIHLHEAERCYLDAHAEQALAAVGVKDLLVVALPDIVLVAKRGKEGDIRKLMARLERSRPELVHAHRRVHRPWGYYETLDTGPQHQIKRIVIHPGGRLSLQVHRQRTEHWVVVEGTAKVTKGNKRITLRKNQSLYIPKGEVHRIENMQETPLEVIEVQSGDYLGEDDIQRIDDHYGRG